MATHLPQPRALCPCSLCAPRDGAILLIDEEEFSPLSARTLGDFRLLLPAQVDCAPALRESAIFTDPWNRRRHANLRPIRESVRWLRRGGRLIVFRRYAGIGHLSRLARLGRASLSIGMPQRNTERLVPRRPA